MSESVQSGNTIPGTSLQTLGGLTLVVAVMVAGWSLFHGDPVTAGAVLLYLPVGYLLYSIGENPDRD
ncbi:MAG: hypothetical protein ABEJ58_03690 [Halodesulfurarchaeum sp.]